MRLSRTVGLGAALAVLPLVAGMAFVVDQLQGLPSQSERVMLRQLAAVRLGTEVATRLDRLTELERKLAVSGDPGYAEKADAVARAIDAQLELMERPDLGAEGDADLASFVARWRRLRAERAPGGDVAPIESLGQEVRALLRRAHEAAVADVARASETREAAMRAAVITTVVALLSSATVLVVMIRRVRRRLDALVSVTEAVSRGSFSAKVAFAGDDELGRVATAFNEMVAALGELERMKADFLSSISHELRTPLVAMVETNQALLDDIAGPLTAQQRRMITLNANAARRLSGMIGDLLELSVVRSELRYRMAPTALGPMVEDAVSELAARARERGLTLEVLVDDEELTVTADRDRLSQVVQNLVDNAIKHAPSDGAVEVSLRKQLRASLPGAPFRTSPSAPKLAVLRVADTGPGIPPADRERVFEKFFRRQGVSADGVGLGLAISREITLAHGGAIWIEDGHRGGASVCVALPLEDA